MLSAVLLTSNYISSAVLPVYAAESAVSEDPDLSGMTYEEQASARKELPVDSNNIPGWPAGPAIGAQSAILMDAETGTILYSKNIHEKLYPASTTKLLTCLIAMEQGSLDDEVKFSYEAVHSVPPDGSNMGMDAGQHITLEECLYGIMVGSANEVANATAEYIAGSIDDFVTLMNERAEELGCTDSHFMNTNGLFDKNHYTSAYDLALIGKAYFANEMLCKIGNTPRYHFEPSEGQPDDFYKNNKHALINGEVPYKGIQGGKTGYTDEARQTLVTCCEQNGMKLICVVMKEESPDQFYDTVTLFDYGFSNFQKVKVADYETSYTVTGPHFFQAGNDIFGSSKQFLTLDQNTYVILPNQISFDALDKEVDYSVQTKGSDMVARIDYSYHHTPIGYSYIHLKEDAAASYTFNSVNAASEENQNALILINVRFCILVLSGGAVLLGLLIIVFSLLKDFHFSEKKKPPKQPKRKAPKSYGRFKDVDF